MKFLVMIYTDSQKIEALREGEFDSMMRGCLTKADELRAQGRLLDSQMLESPARSKSLRVQNGRLKVVDGPFAETKEVLGGFNLIEAESMDQAVRIASEFPWSRIGCIEVRPIYEIEDERQRVFGSHAATDRNRQATPA